MTSRRDRKAEEARARNGFLVIAAVRFGGVAMIMLGFAIARGLIDLPWFVGAIIAVAGFIEFFFFPRLVARALIAKDDTRG
ncbi:hypothetical protein ACLBKU_11775 [Erythrobacter sp. NE805]|uniref:hypothetical protein n=1 Tax=Erythrobacter sp. NE805 TaxID=3389875 RepID=UPI00396AF7F4